MIGIFSNPASSKPFTNSCNKSIHHIRWCNNISTCLSLTTAVFTRESSEASFKDFVSFNHSAMPMVGIFAKTGIGDNDNFWKVFFYVTSSHLNDPMVMKSTVQASFLFSFGIPNNKTDLIPCATMSSISAWRLSMDTWNTPGMDDTS